MNKSYPVPQDNPPLSPRVTLPTMYDLPSEDPLEPGLPDEYHLLQPQLLSRTFRTPCYQFDRIFTGTDINLYYDVRNPLWYKRPDWFVVVGVSRLYDEIELRSSYVTWQEGTNPFIVVEFLSPGTAKEDLKDYGDTEVQIADIPPRKWQVYEQILRVPYYIVFSRYTNQIRFFKLIGGRYEEQIIDLYNPRLWVAELQIGLGLWPGEFEGINRLWLRWYDEQENWILTDTEQERQRAEQAELKLRQIVQNLLQSGLTIEQVAQLTQLSEEQVQNLA